MTSDWWYYLFSLVLLVANLTAWLGNLYRLPGNWIVVCNTLLYAEFFPNKLNGLGLGWGTVLVLTVLAGLGESVSYVVRNRRKLEAEQQIPGLKGTLSGAAAGGLLGAGLGLLIPFMAPFTTVLGSVGGAAAGASLGSFAFMKGQPKSSSKSTADSVFDSIPNPRGEALMQWIELGARFSVGVIMLLIAQSAALTG